MLRWPWPRDAWYALIASRPAYSPLAPDCSTAAMAKGTQPQANVGTGKGTEHTDYSIQSVGSGEGHSTPTTAHNPSAKTAVDGIQAAREVTAATQNASLRWGGTTSTHVRLRGHGREVREVGEVAVQLTDHLQVALGLVLGSERVHVGELGPRDGDHLRRRVQLHGARSERDHGRVQRQIPRLRIGATTVRDSRHIPQQSSKKKKTGDSPRDFNANDRQEECTRQPVGAVGYLQLVQVP